MEKMYAIRMQRVALKAIKHKAEVKNRLRAIKRMKSTNLA